MIGSQEKRLNKRIGCLLRVANTHPYATGSSERFYEFKERICHTFGERDGMDYQYIVKSCWGYGSRGCDENCDKCGGTGIYSDSTVRLERWKVGGHVFHKPNGTIVGAKPTIIGLIRHKHHRNAYLAAIALARLMSFELYWTWLRNVPSASFGRAVRLSERMAKWVVSCSYHLSRGFENHSQGYLFTLVDPKPEPVLF